MRVLLSFSVFLAPYFLRASETPIKECNEAKVQGHCSNLVQSAVNVCELKQDGKDLTAKRLNEAKEGKMATDSNFAELVGKYKKLEDAARTDKENQKACYESATAFKKDCVEKCDNDEANGADCNKSLYSIDQIRTYCKKNEEAAEEVAEVAADDARMLSQVKIDTGSSSSKSSSGTSSSAPIVDTSGVTPPTVQQLGYAKDSDGGSAGGGKEINGGGGAATAGNTDALARGLVNAGGGSGGGGGGGSNAGSTAGLGGDDSGLGRTGGNANGKNLGTGTGTTNDSNGARDGQSAGSGSSVSGKGDQAPGYMFWGTPARKKKAPLTLLKPAAAKVPLSSSSSSAEKTLKIKTPAPTAQ